MTNEEAIEILEEVRTIDDSMYQYNERYLQALDMAIKALEQTDVLDKIRAEIIEMRSKQNCSCSDCIDIIDKYRKEQT